MFSATDHPYLVPFDESFDQSSAPTEPAEDPGSKKGLKKELARTIDELNDLQYKLYADNRYSVLLVFQAMDAAGKDGTIRAVMTGVNPAGCQVFSFKKPSAEEIDHDFLWRTARRLPERGRIGIFNRSYYEEVLVVRVHPEILKSQREPESRSMEEAMEGRYRSIRDHELHLASTGTVILKFWLNVSKEEQKSRFVDRIDDERKNWKFSLSDIEERRHWNRYMEAYEKALRATSKPHAPWYAIPADNKPFMRLAVARILVDSLKRLDLRMPKLDDEGMGRLTKIRETLLEE